LVLFTERGFDQVSVAEIAASADVAEKTVYNHFPTKADLVFDQDADLLAGILEAVRGRGERVSACAALKGYLPAQAGRIGQAQPVERREAFRRMVLASPTLRAHQRAMAARYETALAEVLADATGSDPAAPEPFVAAVALVGALRAGFEARAQAGGVAQAISRALDLLEHGLSRYAPGQPSQQQPASTAAGAATKSVSRRNEQP
jgi:AcrR family transcriptional regulator